MTYHIDPKTEAELDVFRLMEDGIYDFEVYKSERKISKAGNPMAELHLKIWDKNGSLKLMKALLIFSSAIFCTRIVRHFCDATGIIHEYESGEIREDFSGLNGKLELTTKIGQEIPEESLFGKPKGSRYPTKNEVKDYIVSVGVGTVRANVQDGMKPLPEVKDDFSDEIPF